MSHESRLDVRLQDLADDDAQELRAFLEKKDWFEGKLQYLQSLPLISPFLARDADLLVAPIPTKSQIEEWQTERDKLEQDVLAFDGGDLGRMKGMTREVTLLPLTPPSTKLVSITLDLILVVDQLLTFLRQRADLLETVITRYRWNDLMRSAELQLHTLRADLAALMKQDCPPEAAPTNNLSVSAEILKPSSVLSGLRKREAALIMTGKQAGEELDRMVDIAPALDLGMHAQGAVPEEFLDAQDQLDTQIMEIRGKVDWVRELFNQQECADIQLRRCQSLVAELIVALEAPASSLLHRRLQIMLDSIQIPQDDLPRPSHPDKNRLTIATLGRARQDAQDRIALCQAGIAWYGDLVNKCRAVADRQSLLESACSDIHSELKFLSNLRPDFREPRTLMQNFSVWIAAASRQEQRRHLIEETRLQIRYAELDMIRYRQALRSGPSELGSPTPPDPVISIDEAYDQTKTLADESESVANDLLVLRTVQRIMQSTTSLKNELASLRATIDAAIEHGSEDLDGLVTLGHRLDYQCRVGVRDEVEQLRTTLDGQKRSLLSLQVYIDNNIANISSDISHAAEVLHRLRCQVQAIQDIEKEATDLSTRIADTLPNLSPEPTFSSLAVTSGILDLTRDLKSWEASISDRIVFIGDLHPSGAAADNRARRVTNSIVLRIRALFIRSCHRQHVDRVNLPESVTTTEQVDVFGTIPPTSDLDGERATLHTPSHGPADLQPQLCPSPSLINESPELERLSNPAQADLMDPPFDRVAESAAALAPCAVIGPETPHLPHSLALSRQADSDPDRLVNPAATVSDYDRALSEFLASIDTFGIREALSSAHTVSANVSRRGNEARSSHDPRADAEYDRVMATFADVHAVIHKSRQPDEETSDAASLYSIAVTESGHSTSGVQSGPDPLTLKNGTSSSHSRAVLDSSRHIEPEPMVSRTSLQLVRTSSGSTRPRWSPESSRAPSALSRRQHFSNHEIRQAAEAKTKLDLAVGRVVWGLQVDVPIVPVALQDPADWKDESGTYWIGAEGQARLCYCRILRSRMVMVRVGGGWMELSKFLLDHFADAFLVTPPRASNVKPLEQDVSPGTCSPLQTAPQDEGTPTRSQSVTTTIPQVANDASLNSSNPLLPLQFIRRASESPPIREKEKARMTRGLRRSTLSRTKA